MQTPICKLQINEKQHKSIYTTLTQKQIVYFPIMFVYLPQSNGLI